LTSQNVRISKLYRKPSGDFKKTSWRFQYGVRNLGKLRLMSIIGR